jgi:hypothetical protein
VYKKRLAQKEQELHIHRINQLTLDNVDNTDSELSDMLRSTTSSTVPLSNNARHSPNGPTPFSLGQNIWSASSNQNSGTTSPTENLTTWGSARSFFPTSQESLSQTGHSSNAVEPPNPVGATFTHASNVVRPSLPNGSASLRGHQTLNVLGNSTKPNSNIPVIAGMSHSHTTLLGNTQPIANRFSMSNSSIENPQIGYLGQNFNPSTTRVSVTPVTKMGHPPRMNISAATAAATRLSPTAAEFNVESQWRNASSPMNLGMGSASQQSYTTPPPSAGLRENGFASGTDWNHLVEKIIHGNDQQASILMQQKIKTVDRIEKVRMCDAIVHNCEALMTNRFGNFLVQRVLEHGTVDQISYVAASISGRVVPLSMDAFGCHVVQKAFDTVSEEFKIRMVQELLCAIPETVKHRYACHVWQKLFELRWTVDPPQIMNYVNESLASQWWDVAMGETGSLVVQNIFENCNDEDKRPCIEEVLAKIDVISKGQYGNWCIQHVCEHGAEPDRTRAVNHILAHASEYSMDQFASKVVEKCLKIGGGDFLEPYLSRVCSPQGGRPRVPLVDIACNQYGNYLIQWVLQYAESDEHKDIVRMHAR